MNPQRFIQSYKCDCFQPFNYCNCPNKSTASGLLMENVKEVAKTLIEVMKLCYVPASKALRAIDVVIYYFLHFEEIRHRIDSVPKKRLCKEDLFHDLHRKCDMTRSEAQMTYSIVKRAFRAFYHGTAEGGVPNPLLGTQLVHSQECMWVHASMRTAQIFAAYEGIFMVTQRDIECKIKQLYKDLYDRIHQADLENGNHECTCTKCAKRIMRESLKTVKVTTGMHSIADPYEAMYREIVDKMMYVEAKVLANGNEHSNSAEGRHCTCPTLKITDSDSIHQKTAQSCNSGYSQGPFDCHWAPISKEEYDADDADPIIELPNEYPCPPCEDGLSSCDSECVCNCEVCTCHSVEQLECVGESVEDEDLETSLEIEENELSSRESATKINANIDERMFSIKYSGCKDPTEVFKMTSQHLARKSIEKLRSKSSDGSIADGFQDANNNGNSVNRGPELPTMQ